MDWKGKPAASWSNGAHGAGKDWNAGLHVKIRDYGDDAGVASATARTLTFYAAKSGDKAAQKVAKELLDRMWAKHRDKLGVSTPETRVDYKRFADPVYVPAAFRGKMPNGDPLESGATFTSIRSKYRSDPAWPKVEAYLKGGKPPVFTYHRMWGQSDIAIANAMYGWLFPDDKAAGGGAVQAGLKEAGGEAGEPHRGSGRAHSSRSKKQKTH
jgi:hypothetical protein